MSTESDQSGHPNAACSFCGKSYPEVRALIEGGCRNPVKPQCVFICNECVAFCSQVIADNGWGNTTSSEGRNLSLTEVDASIEDRMMGDSVVWRGVVIEEAVDVIEPKTFGILIGAQVSDALNVTLT